MKILRRIGMAAAAALALSATAAGQIRIVDRASLDSLANPVAAACAGQLQFETITADAGTMSEDDAPRTFEYRFRNAGERSITVTRLTASCSCTCAEARPATVRAGGEGTIVVTYDPKGHVGRFTRRVFVYTNLSERQPTAVLKLETEVTAGEDMSGEFPFAAGMLRMKRESVSFSRRVSEAQTIEVCNAGDKPLTIGCNANLLPPCISFACSEKVLAPKQKADITVKFAAELMPEGRSMLTVPLVLTGTGAGTLQSRIMITINDKEE